MRDSQRGVALISMLLIVAIATVMAVSIIQTQRSSLMAAQGYLARAQAAQYARGGEELGRQILFEDFENTKGIDSLGEIWAAPDLVFEFEDGEVQLIITDLQALVNLNGLNGRRASIMHDRTANIFNAHTIDLALLDRISDWIDVDENTRPAGAEDFEYLIMEPPYRSANVLMSDISELRLLGIGPDQYDQLANLIATLPDENSGLNVNTAGPGVLQALSPEITFEAAESLTQRRDESEGYDTVEQFLQEPELAGLGIMAEGLSVQSAFFEIQIVARYQDRYAYLTSLVHRDTTDGSMRVIQRDFSRNLRPVREKESNRSG